jgi:5-hydroxyisourate hydrolase-like protein (transthyretin family)
MAVQAMLAQSMEVSAVNSADGTPIAGVKVELRQAGKVAGQGTTDAQGAYRFDALPDGDYTAEFTKFGYRRLDRYTAEGHPFHVAAGGNLVRVEVRLLRLGKISGRVIGAGKPVALADVQLLLSGNFIGQNTRTDSKGEFHFVDVDPGTYILSARATKASAPPPAEEDGRKLGWLRTWYPNAPDSMGAAKLTITGGADLLRQDILLRSVPVHHISGHVLSERGEPMSGVTVNAAPPEEFATAEFELTTQTKDDGTFELAGVPDGNWRVTAETKVNGVAWYAAVVEGVAGHDIDRRELRLMPPFSISGKVVRTPSGTPAEKKEVGVMLASSAGGSHVSWAVTQNDGSFRIDDMAPGLYRFQPTSPGAPYYLASIEMNGRDVLGEWVEVAPGTLPVTITYRADGGTVRGTVEDCGGATVVLAPQTPALQYSEFVRQTRCQQGGRFEITGMRPGEYYAFAFDQPVGMLDLSSFAAKWVAQAVRVTVRPGEATDASLKVTQRGGY